MIALPTWPDAAPEQASWPWPEETQALLQQVLAPLPDAVLLLRVEPGGSAPQLLYANEAAHAWLHEFESVAPRDTGESASQVVWRSVYDRLRGDAPAHFTVPWGASEGHRALVEVSLAPLAAGPGVWRVSFRDLTRNEASLRRVAQAQRLELLGRMASGVAHDVNNLLHVIAGYSSLAQGRLKGRTNGDAGLQQAEQALLAVQDAAARAAALTRQVLAFNRRQRADRQPVRVDHLLDDAAPLLQRLAGNAVHVAVHVPPSPVPPVVCADPSQLEQVLMNLVVNARDAQPDGGRVQVRLDVLPWPRVRGAHTVAPTAPYVVRLCVGDEGPGIPSALRERVFEPFFTTKRDGTGLGLSTVHGIVRQANGDIRLGSGPRGGLEVEVLFPWCGVTA